MTPEPNYFEIALPTVPTTSFQPEANTPAVTSSGSNVVPAPNGSVLNGGSLYSPNFSKGVAGWAINAAGDAEFNNGTFRGALVAASIDIPDTTTANSFHVDSSGNAWWGATTLGSAVASVTKAGLGTFSNIVITGGSIAIGSANAIFKADSNGIYLGNATFASAPFSVSMAGALVATSATITGSITSTSGAIGGFTIGATTLSATNLTLTSGAANTAAITVGTGSNLAGMNSANASGDITFWAGDTFANRATAPFHVTAAGAVTGSNITITGGSVVTSVLNGLVGLTNLNVANRGWSQNCAFSVTDADTIAWGSGTFTAADGTAYSISASNTGNMAAKTYIYLDIGVSTTAYQTTTTSTTAVGSGKVLVAIAQNATNEATYTVLSGQGGQNIDAANIVTGSITANEIAASTITAGKLSVSTLSSIAADLGAITAGSIVLPSGGYIRSGQTAYNTGTGWYIGNDSGIPKFSIGDGNLNAVTWDGTTLTIEGTLKSGNPLYGDGSDGDLHVTSGTTTLASDKFYRHVIVDSGAVLVTASYALYANVSIVNNGTIKNNGNVGGDGQRAGLSGTGGTAGTAVAAGTFSAGLAGVAGGNGAIGAGSVGGNGTNLNPSLVNASGTNGGASGSGRAGGTGGTATSETLNLQATVASKSGISSGTVTNISTLLRVAGSSSSVTLSLSPSGGSGGAGDGDGGGTKGAGGGGSGSNGGVCFIASPSITNTGTISANGGNGGAGGNNNGGAATSGGGGAGGNGGVVALIYSTLSDSGSITASGGTKGAKGDFTAGDGQDGNAGKVYKIKVGNNVVA